MTNLDRKNMGSKKIRKFIVIKRLRSLIRDAIKRSPLSRHQIANEMSYLLGKSITKDIVNSWTRESDEINGRPGRHIPAEYLPAFCQVTGSNEPLAMLAKTVGMLVFQGWEAIRVEIKIIDEQIKSAQSKRNMLLKIIEAAHSRKGVLI